MERYKKWKEDCTWFVAFYIKFEGSQFERWAFAIKKRLANNKSFLHFQPNLISDCCTFVNTPPHFHSSDTTQNNVEIYGGVDMGFMYDMGRSKSFRVFSVNKTQHTSFEAMMLWAFIAHAHTYSHSHRGTCTIPSPHCTDEKGDAHNWGAWPS